MICRTRMYKTRFAKWDLHKYNRKDEMMTILSKKTERAAVGKKSAFQLRGRQVDMADAERYLKRKGITTRDIMAWRATGATTPPGLRCFTPEPIRPYPAAPKMFHIPESLFADIRAYFVGFIRSGNVGFAWRRAFMLQHEGRRYLLQGIRRHSSNSHISLPSH